MNGVVHGPIVDDNQFTTGNTAQVFQHGAERARQAMRLVVRGNDDRDRRSHDLRSRDSSLPRGHRCGLHGLGFQSRLIPPMGWTVLLDIGERWWRGVRIHVEGYLTSFRAERRERWDALLAIQKSGGIIGRRPMVIQLFQDGRTAGRSTYVAHAELRPEPQVGLVTGVIQRMVLPEAWRTIARTGAGGWGRTRARGCRRSRV